MLKKEIRPAQTKVTMVLEEATAAIPEVKRYFS
jgi:hypothetical protein